MNRINESIARDRRFNFSSRIKSIGHACNGVYRFLKEEQNARIHLAATFLVILLSWKFQLGGWELGGIIFVTALVWITEIINTAIEKIMDHLSPEIHPSVKYIKDLAAAAVLVAAIAALVTGLIVFIPKILTV